MAEEFSKKNPGVTVTVDGPGTGDGFALFCNGETDISHASRPIKDEEKAACQQNGIQWIELKIGFDGITVMTNPANSAVGCLTKADLYALVGLESTAFRNWSDANPLDKELGGAGTFPDLPLDITAPGEESGTCDAFIELALKSIAGTVASPPTRPRPTTGPRPRQSGTNSWTDVRTASRAWPAVARPCAYLVSTLGTLTSSMSQGERG